MVAVMGPEAHCAFPLNLPMLSVQSSLLLQLLKHLLLHPGLVEGEVRSDFGVKPEALEQFPHDVNLVIWTNVLIHISAMTANRACRAGG